MDKIRSDRAYLEASCCLLFQVRVVKRCTYAPLDKFEPGSLDQLDLRGSFYLFSPALGKSRLHGSKAHGSRLSVKRIRLHSDLHTFNVNERNSWLGTRT